MAEFKHPIPLSVLRRIADEWMRDGKVITVEMATIDYIVDKEDRHIKRSERDYADRWRWKKSTVHDRMELIKSAASEWKTLYPGSIRAAAGQNSAKTAPKTANDRAASGQHPGKIGNAPILDNQISEVNSKEKPLRGKKKGSLDRNKMVMDSWNDFASRYQLPTIRKLSSLRMRWIKSRFDVIWPEIEEIYEAIPKEPFLLGENERGWRINFDYLWRDDTNYLKVLEGGHWPRPNGAKRTESTSNGKSRRNLIHGRGADKASPGDDSSGGYPKALLKGASSGKLHDLRGGAAEA